MSKNNIEETGGEFVGVPNDKYAKLFAKFAEIETLEVAQWKPAHLLAYFCKKYKETYGVDYAWKFNNPNPNKCFEVWQLNVLISKLSANPTNPERLHRLGLSEPWCPKLSVVLLPSLS